MASEADQYKAKGNEFFAKKQYDEAIAAFTKAIEVSPTPNHILYSNRSGSFASKKDFDSALKDANECIKISPTWVKGYTRKAAALHGQGDLVDARDAYEEALKLDPSNAQAQSGLKSVDEAIKAEASQDGTTPDMGLGGMFNDQNMWAKLAASPKTSSYLADRAFVEKLKRIQQNPAAASQEMMSDPRIMQVMAVLLGIDITMPNGAPNSEEPKDSPMPDAPKPAASSSSSSKVEEPVEEEPQEEDDEAKKKAQAEEEKAKGNKEYKSRNFDAAIEHYQKAWELHQDVTYLNNLAAAEFEKGDLEGCIETCEKAIEEGRALRTDYKIIAKSFGRVGTAYHKLGNLDKSIEYYNRSLTEHRTPDVLAKLRAVEKEKKQKDIETYIDPEKAEQAREEGNALFKAADWPGAVKAYTEMIKRAPNDARGYSNRAAAYIKLLSFPEAVKDCDMAIEKDPNFIRAYIRKANAYFTMREYTKCIDTLNEASERDTKHENYSEIESLRAKALSARFQAQEGETEEQTMERISKDPEVIAILQDPVMQSILGQARENPAALNDHMKNPEVRKKIQLLVAAGIIRTR
ncbi:hypothetical protein POJ06DRAFT_248237 [Lipomyces tetrasporus]|uniref:STI1 domain-containing protein n=1 Tax=Lipomyces tetrasporus TaxID=54092 RepID=A0AAD7VTX2_9ASCO|nr:uncharacterized protein POJ06DRAFT_248237 [Lipomyces tetrasporus]KAJ8101918.1 hypothetical protein POJ06DRAFT_248237 [Lipomyces tetrasporus]